MLNEHVAGKKKTSGHGFRRLYTYTKMDLPCLEVDSLYKVVKEEIMPFINAIIREVYVSIFDIPLAENPLVPVSKKEPHFLHYKKEEKT